MSRSYPVITLWLLENPFDIITLWQLQEGKCSISSPTSTLFWEPGASLFSTSWSAKCLWGKCVGCLRNQGSRDQSGVESFQSKLWIQESHSQGTGNGLIITSAQGGNYSSTREENLVLSKKTLEYFPPFCVWHYISIYKRNLQYPAHYNMLNILICQYEGQ